MKVTVAQQLTEGQKAELTRPKRVWVIPAKPLKPEVGKGRGWRRASGKLK